MTHTLLQSGVIGTLFDVRWSLVAQANPENDEIFFVCFVSLSSVSKWLPHVKCSSWYWQKWWDDHNFWKMINSVDAGPYWWGRREGGWILTDLWPLVICLSSVVHGYNCMYSIVYLFILLHFRWPLKHSVCQRMGQILCRCPWNFFDRNISTIVSAHLCWFRLFLRAVCSMMSYCINTMVGTYWSVTQELHLIL